MLHFLFSFRGRASRADIWKFTIACIALVLVLEFVFKVKVRHGGDVFALSQQILSQPPGADRFLLIFFLLFTCVITLAGLAIATRRLHDREKSAWWLIPFWALPRLSSALVPPSGLFAHTSHTWFDLPVALIGLGLGFWAFLELFCFGGSIGDNAYGRDPLPRPVINPFAEQVQ